MLDIFSLCTVVEGFVALTNSRPLFPTLVNARDTPTFAGIISWSVSIPAANNFALLSKESKYRGTQNPAAFKFVMIDSSSHSTRSVESQNSFYGPL